MFLIILHIQCGVKVLHILEQIAADTELSDIDAIAMELRNIREQRQQVYKVATNALNKGTASENTAQTTNALQVSLMFN